MESYIQISKLNDFIFCPLSLYFHSLYENFNEKTYHSSSQVVGKIKHEKIDNQEYSSEKRYLQGLEIFSEKYELIGKIDIYDKKEKALIERKYQIKNIYDGYRYQLYAQMICLEEMSFGVEKIFLHSLKDNKRYNIPLPNDVEMKKFNKLVEDIKNFSFKNIERIVNKNKCNNCIYSELCIVNN